MPTSVCNAFASDVIYVNLESLWASITLGAAYTAFVVVEPVSSTTAPSSTEPVTVTVSSTSVTSGNIVELSGKFVSESSIRVGVFATILLCADANYTLWEYGILTELPHMAVA